MEKIFSALDCPEVHKTQFTTYRLVDSANVWWEMLRVGEAPDTPLPDWMTFKRIFHEHFISDAQHFMKTQEFKSLK